MSLVGSAVGDQVLLISRQPELSRAALAPLVAGLLPGMVLQVTAFGSATALALTRDWALVIVDAHEDHCCPPISELRAATAAPLVVLAPPGSNWVEPALAAGADEVSPRDELPRAIAWARARRAAMATGGTGADGELPSPKLRLRRHNELLRTLATQLGNHDLATQLHTITEAAARGMEVARIGVWLFDAEHRRIRAEDLYDSRSGTHEAGVELTAAAFPEYFEALEEDRVIAADDAATHPATRCFADGYLAVHGISSMLDAPIRVGGKVLGVLCHEHVGPPRVFTDEDQSAAGSLADFVALALESRERGRAEDALLSSNRRLEEVRRIEAVGRLAGGVAHDFNNVITVISSYAFLLAKKLDKSDSLQGPVAEISKATERAADITRKLLAFTRQSPAAVRVLDLNAILRGAELFLRRMIGEHILLTVEPHPTPVMLKADPGQVEQILLNLVINARDVALPEGGSITVRTREEVHTENGHPAPQCVLEVEDNGPGMTPEVRARIFEPLFATKDMGGGHGLGLFTVMGAVDQMGAVIDVASSPDRGSRFTVRFPGASAEARREADREHDRRTLRGSERILLVEDEPQVREVTSLILKDFGYHVMAASNIDDAVAQAKREKVFDLLISDIVMPRASGPVVAARLRTLLPDLRILFITGYSQDMLGGYDASLGPTLPKPFTAEQLGKKVRQVLDQGASSPWPMSQGGRSKNGA